MLHNPGNIGRLVEMRPPKTFGELMWFRVGGKLDVAVLPGMAAIAALLALQLERPGAVTEIPRVVRRCGEAQHPLATILRASDSRPH